MHASPASRAPAKARQGYQVMSDVTPGRYFSRYLCACEHTAYLRAAGTKISAVKGKIEEKNFIYLDYQTACNAYVWRPNRAAALQCILDAAMEREQTNREAMQSHNIYTTRAENIAVQNERAFFDRIDTMFPPAFPSDEQARVAFEPAERAAARDEIESFSTTPHLWYVVYAVHLWYVVQLWYV